MAYFDDPEKRESWEKAMAELREERARRISGGEPLKPASLHGAAMGRGHSQAGRVPVSYRQLIEEDSKARGITHPDINPEKSKRPIEKAGPERHVPTARTL